MQLHLLMGATVLAFGFGVTSTALHLQDANSLQFSAMAPPSVDRIMEWRPQGPPPWMEVDQLSPDEAEQPGHMAAGEGEARGREGSSARSRPER